MVRLRPTVIDDLDLVFALEHHPDNREFIGQWTRDEHVATMRRPDRQHLVIESDAGGWLGYLISYDTIHTGFGVYIKRFAVAERSRGTGRAALGAFAARTWAAGAPLISLAVRSHNLRAQRCYAAVGFDTWSLDDAGRAEFTRCVDPVDGSCLVMRLEAPVSVEVV
jgi:ribosomal protein S18 acetylase RimI-like enzyme